MSNRSYDNKAIIPSDRTCRQPVECFCRNPECLERSDQKQFTFTTEEQHVVCPKCGANASPLVGVLSLVHFLHRKKDGPIIGVGGLEFALACDSDRAYLATMTNNEAATDQLHCVNCPGCLKAAKEQKLKDKSGRSLSMSEIQLLDRTNPG